MILINLQLAILTDRRVEWLGAIRRYGAAVQSEHGCAFFKCFESIDEANQFAIIECFESSEAGERHVATDHFSEFIAFMPSVLAAPPKIINVEVAQDDWSTMSEIEVGS